MARILLVDDNQDSRFAVVETLRKLTDHAIEEVDSGPATLERVRRSDYDLVLLDVQMPGMDGFEVCRRLRADDRTRRLPVLFLTATHYQVESRLKGLEVGADDFIVQPISNQELVARIKSVLRVKALADEIRQHNTELESKVRQRTVDVEKLANQLRAERDILRETFDVFDEGLSLVGPSGALEVVNATGRRLYDSPRARRAGVAGARDHREGGAVRGVGDPGRSRLRRARACRSRAAAPWCSSATSPRTAIARCADCRPRSWRRSACWPPASRTRSTTRRRSCSPTSRRWSRRCGSSRRRSASCPASRTAAPWARSARCCSRPRRCCRSRRRGWSASTASCATSARSRTPTTIRRRRSTSTPPSSRR